MRVLNRYRCTIIFDVLESASVPFGMRPMSGVKPVWTWTVTTSPGLAFARVIADVVFGPSATVNPIERLVTYAPISHSVQFPLNPFALCVGG